MMIIIMIMTTTMAIAIAIIIVMFSLISLWNMSSLNFIIIPKGPLFAQWRVLQFFPSNSLKSLDMKYGLINEIGYNYLCRQESSTYQLCVYRSCSLIVPSVPCRSYRNKENGACGYCNGANSYEVFPKLLNLDRCYSSIAALLAV